MKPTRLLLFVILSINPPNLVITTARAADSPSALETSPDGWIDLLADAGQEVRGWTRLPIPPGGEKQKADTSSQWSLDPKTGTLLCRGDGGHEWLRYDRELGDFVYHVEWRFTPVAGRTGKYNSGIYARNSADARVWHQAQTGDASGGFLFGESPLGGSLQRFNLAKDVTRKRVKPAGEWNTFEITCKGQRMSLWVNGAVTCEFKACGYPKGYVGLEAEGYQIEFKNITLKVIE